MRPLKGVVVGYSGQTLTINTESGLTITIPRRKSMEVGSLVHIFYDFTNNKVVKVSNAPGKVEEDEIGDEEPEEEYGHYNKDNNDR